MRPPLLRELRGYRPYQCTAAVEEGKQSILLSENLPAVATGTGISPDGLLYATYRWVVPWYQCRSCMHTAEREPAGSGR